MCQRGNSNDKMSKGMPSLFDEHPSVRDEAGHWRHNDAWNALDGAKMKLCKSRPKSYGQKEQSRQWDRKAESEWLTDHLHVRMETWNNCTTTWGTRTIRGNNHVTNRACVASWSVRTKAEGACDKVEDCMKKSSQRVCTTTGCNRCAMTWGACKDCAKAWGARRVSTQAKDLCDNRSSCAKTRGAHKKQWSRS